jgi:hypothetical protein
MAAALQVVALAVSSGFAFDSVPPSSWKTADHDGVTVAYLPGFGAATGLSPSYAVFDGTGLIATSRDEAFRIIDTAHGAPAAIDDGQVAAALADVPSSESVVFLDLSGIVDAVSNIGMMDPGTRANLDALRTLVAGVRSDRDRQHARIVVRVG